MNVVFELSTPDEDLTKKFVAESEKQELLGLKGHRIAGGFRASIYNALPLEGVVRLVEFMKKFEASN